MPMDIMGEQAEAEATRAAMAIVRICYREKKGVRVLSNHGRVQCSGGGPPGERTYCTVFYSTGTAKQGTLSLPYERQTDTVGVKGTSDIEANTVSQRSRVSRTVSPSALGLSILRTSGEQADATEQCGPRLDFTTLL